ncbi:Kazal-type serine protease inhibitor family protein [uncultured Spirosoma sp.]|uniref:Kazal-type serine protease inhibitor family protein n=1 Tax=uncultured Spirosoma sp. TaxID=278208 RepID=UPI002583911A|nr:Kazal-type serine protease inhibitor family protein [uncultured Spirosoma sp.]
MRQLLVLLVFLGIGAGCRKDVEPDCIPRTDTCACPYVFNPVCGCDGRTYANACVAQCAGIRYVAGACGK